MRFFVRIALFLGVTCLCACQPAAEATVRVRAITPPPATATALPAVVDADMPWLRASVTATPTSIATARPGVGATGAPVATVPAQPTVIRTAPRSATPAVRRTTPATGDAPLLAAIRDALGPDADDASVVVRRLTDGVEARWRADELYYAASLYKLEVMYEAYRQRQTGQIAFEQEVPLTGRAAGEDLGTFNRVPRGAEGGVEIGEAVRAMITWSDNVSAALLLDTLGHRSIDATMAGIGLRESSVNTTELPTTAADMARLMEAIVRGEGLGGQAASEMTALLLRQEMRHGIPAGLPPGVPVGNKWGAWPGAAHDVAFVVAPHGAYVIAILTSRGWDWNLIARVSRAVWSHLEGPVR